MLRASLVALAVLALSAGGAGAATGSFKIGTAAGTTAADCTAAGGTVVTDTSGNKICKLLTAPASPSGSAPSGREPSN
jgi:hypothetical protein